MIHNLNARRLTDGSYLAQYQEDGHAKDASHRSWTDFVAWLATLEQLNPEIKL